MHRRIRRFQGAWALTLAAAACGPGPDSGGPTPSATGETGGSTGDTGPDTCLRSVPGLTVGQGADRYIALAPTDDVYIVHGQQGGWHVDTSGIVVGTGPTVRLRPTLTIPSTSEQLAGDQDSENRALVDYDAETCTGTFFGLRAFLDDTSPPEGMRAHLCALDGVEAEIAVWVADLVSGAEVTAAARAILHPDPDDTCN